MRIKLIHFFSYICAVIILCSCKKQTEQINFPLIKDYYPLSTGKVFIYKLDSTVIPAFGSDLITYSLLAKDSIADTFNDNIGRLSYKVYRFTTDSLQTKPWTYRSTYYITPTVDDIQLVDDYNLRFIKLIQPLKENFNWKGNAFIDTKSPDNNFQYLDNWDYTYQNVNKPYTVLKGTFDSTITVFQRDELSPNTPFDVDFFQERNYSVEIYAKGVGLIYKEFLHWTWQPTPPPAQYKTNSFGIKLNLVEVK